MNKKFSRLEIFPDELFLDLFSYIPPNDLYRVWNGLNRRLSAILSSVRISFDLIETTDDNTRALNYFSQQIVFIRLRTPYAKLDLKNCPNLHSLIIDTTLTKEQLECIHPYYLPNLKRLSFSKWSKDEEIVNEAIFNRDSSNEQLSQWLKVYHLPSIPNYFIANTSNLSHIHTLVFDRVTPCDIDLILSLQPTLRSLKVTIVRWMNDDTISRIALTNKNYQHRYLVHLDTTMNTCNRLDDLYPLLSHLPCLRSLYVACDSLTVGDFQQLAFELFTRVPWLGRFNCSFKQTYIEDMQKLHFMSPLFWRMKCRKIEWSGGWHYYCVTTGDL